MARSRKFRKTSRRRRGTKRSLRRRSSSYKRRRSFRSTNQHSYVLRRSVLGAIFVPNATITQGDINVNAGAFPNFTELSGLYDQYKVKWVKLSIRPKFPKFTDPTSNVSNAYFFSVLDYDSAPGSTFTRAAMQQYRNVHVTRLYQTHTRTYKPCAIQAVSILGISGAPIVTNIKRSGWFDFATPVDTYNFRYYLDPVVFPAGVTDVEYDIDMVIGISCRNVR